MSSFQHFKLLVMDSMWSMCWISKSAGIHLFFLMESQNQLKTPENTPSGSAFELCLPTLCVGLNAFYSMGQPPHNIDTNICLLTAILWTNLLQILIPISVLQY